MATLTFPHCSWPVGFGFRPTEEELISHYLKNKILGQESLVQYIREIDLYKYEPWQLPEKARVASDNYEWLFFRAHTSKTKRTTASGCWRITGDDRPIKARGTNKVIATRKILVFHKGRGFNAVKTNWVIHEYHLSTDTDIPHQGSFVICRLKENAEETDVSDTQETNRGPQANGQSVRQPIWHSTPQPAWTDLPSVNENMQPIQAAASENECSLTELLNILTPDLYFDDVTSNVCKYPWFSEPEPALMDFRPLSDNDGEVNNQLLHLEASNTEINFADLLLNLVEDENYDEVTSNNRIDNYNQEDLDSMVYELQDPDADTTFGIPVLQNNHISPRLHECTRSTIKKSRRSPLIVKRFQYNEEKDKLRGNSSVLPSDNPVPGITTFKAQCQPKSINAVVYGTEPKRDGLKREIRSKTMAQDKQAREDEKHIEIVDSPQLSITYSINERKGEGSNRATKSGVSCCGSTGSTRNCFSNILTTKQIHHKSSLPVVYVAKAFLGIVMFVMFAQELLLYRHSRR